MRGAVTATEMRSPLLSGWTAFGSGTMALAAALRCTAEPLPAGTRVVLPAYSCPDIVAAALFAGLTIHFADLAPGQTGTDLRLLDAGLNLGARVAVLVDLFGSQAPLAEARAIADRYQAVLVHDRAQSLAGPGLDTGQIADFVIVSRGRGKPATLLGGGASRARDATHFTAFATKAYPLAEWSPTSAMLRAATYNLAVHPLLYGAVSRLPFLHIGETRLRTLAAVTRLPQTWLAHAARQLRQQQENIGIRTKRTLAIAELIPAKGFRIPQDALKAAATEGLNRLPVSCDSVEQARRLVRGGTQLGISPLYGRTLPEFLGMSAAEAATAYPVAYHFSRTLVTLPTHGRIDTRAQRQLRELFRNAS